MPNPLSYEGGDALEYLTKTLTFAAPAGTVRYSVRAFRDFSSVVLRRLACDRRTIASAGFQRTAHLVCPVPLGSRERVTMS